MVVGCSLGGVVGVGFWVVGDAFLLFWASLFLSDFAEGLVCFVGLCCFFLWHTTLCIVF